MFEKGLGCEQDDKKAFKWYRESAGHGNAGSQYKVGSMLKHGTGCPKDDEQAYFWIKQAAEQKYDDAERFLQLYYPHKKGVVFHL